MTIRSTPSGSCGRTWRNASRNSRFQRLRTTALPSRRETERPSRGCSRPLRWPKTTIHGSDNAYPPAHCPLEVAAAADAVFGKESLVVHLPLWCRRLACGRKVQAGRPHHNKQQEVQAGRPHCKSLRGAHNSPVQIAARALGIMLVDLADRLAVGVAELLGQDDLDFGQ